MADNLQDEPVTSWTKEWPHKADAGDAYYFVRRDDRDEVVVMGFSMSKAWLNGVAYEPSELRNHLFLGPLKPADTERLVRLREVAIRALGWFELEFDRDNEPQAATALRGALEG